jgi:hypothetical protein
MRAVADMSFVHVVRMVQIAGAGIALAGCALFFMNVQTSANAWRHAHPAGPQGESVNIPAKKPPRDASGPTGWSWPEGTPGWRAGERIQGLLIPFSASAKELAGARASAVRAGLEETGVRVVDALHVTRHRLIAVLAAPMANDPARTCLGTMVKSDANAQWSCPSDLGNSPALIVATSPDWPAAFGTNKHALYLVGVTRGDVRRVVLRAPGFAPERLYERGHTWGQFDASVTVIDGSASLRIYGRPGLLEVVRLAVKPGQARVFH